MLQLISIKVDLPTSYVGSMLVAFDHKVYEIKNERRNEWFIDKDSLPLELRRRFDELKELLQFNLDSIKWIQSQYRE